MALKTLMLRKKIDDKRKEIDSLRSKDADFESREKELERSIEEAQTEEEKQTVTEAIDSFEQERADHEEAKSGLEQAVNELEEQLREAEEADKAAEEAATNDQKDSAGERGKDEKMEVRDAAQVKSAITHKLDNMSAQERSAIFEREDVKAWISEIREHISEKRELTNVGLTIPQVFLGYLRENVLRYSKLYRHVAVQRIGGKGREVIMGSVPEAIWTECCATLNELSLGFNDVEVDCYKVGGYFKVCNAVLEDSDIALASMLLDAIGQAIGLALDKAILYGRNTANNQKMPLGIVSRLTQTTIPANYPATARGWTNLSSSNVRTIAAEVTGLALFQQLVFATGFAKNNYARGEKVWVMNETTYTYLKVQAMSINAAGAIVSGMDGTMPIVGGIVEVLDFVPDYVIIGGYMELYLLAERAGQQFAQSEHAFFIQDQTVFKGTARYDGTPVIAEAFVAIGLNGITPTSEMPFAPDQANGPKLDSPAVAAETETLFGVAASDVQENIAVNNNYITGTLKKLTGSNQITDVWGEGYFMFLKFSDIDSNATTVKVGMNPTMGSGLVALDADRNGVFKVTDKNTQTFKVVSIGANGQQTIDTYYLGALNLDD